MDWTKEKVDYYAEEFKKLNTPLVWDALYVEYGYRNQILRHQVKPILRNMQVAGPAVTVKGTARVTPMEDEFRKPGPGPLGGMWTRVADMITPGCVVLVDAGYTEVAVLGDIFATSWKYAGMQGLVCDGPVRGFFRVFRGGYPAVLYSYHADLCGRALADDRRKCAALAAWPAWRG